MTTYLDLMQSNNAFTNPALGVITPIRTMISNVSSQLEAKRLTQTGTPNTDPFDIDARLNRLAALVPDVDLYEEHTGHITNNVTLSGEVAYRPTYNDALRASAGISTAKDIVSEASSAGVTLASRYDPVVSLGNTFYPSDLFSSVDATNINTIQSRYNTANSRYNGSYATANSQFNGDDVSKVNAYVSQVDALIGEIESAVSTMSSLVTNDTDAFNSAEAAVSLLDEVGLMIAGVNDSGIGSIVQGFLK